MNLIPKFRGLAALLFLLALIVVTLFAFFRRSGLPTREGEFQVAGLKGKVEIVFDRFAVPHIQADHDEDAAAALGWLHANDRFTQMELGRRAAAGRLAELLGERVVSVDRYFRILRLATTAAQLEAGASERSKLWLAAYARGVNAWLVQRDGWFGPELRVLGADPEPWKPTDSLAFALLMAVDLSFWDDHPEEDRYLWLRAFGADATRELLVDADLHIPAEIQAEASRTGNPAQGKTAALDQALDPPGSNNWTIGGSRTASGKPLLASDPHLGLHLPSVWYQAMIRSPGYRAAGMTLPGTPGVVIGRGEKIAWAFTNTMLDDQDIFFERLDQKGENYMRGDRWLPLESHEEVIRIRGGKEETIRLRSTDRGPLLEADSERGLPPRSLAWTGHLPADPLQALGNLAMAETPEQALAALLSYTCPAQNLVASFESGELFFTVIGGIPDRLAGDGRLPSPGWDPAYGWAGLRPRATNPTVLRPVDELLVTANSDIRPAGYELPLSADFMLPTRANRIRERLLERADFTQASFAEIHVDDTSLFAREVLEAIELDGPFKGDAESAYQALKTWDQRMTKQGKAALFALFQRQLLKNIYGDEQALAGSEKAIGRREALLALLRAPGSRRFFDDIGTPELESRGEMLQRSLQEAWNEGVKRWGPTVATWNYGKLHTLTLRHRLDAMPHFGSWMRRGPYQVPGSAETVLAFGARWLPDGNQTVTYGPSMRWVVDWSQPDKAFAVIPGGQSGHPADPHYDDQIPLYLDGQLHEAPWSKEAIEAAAVSRLLLLPN